MKRFMIRILCVFLMATMLLCTAAYADVKYPIATDNNKLTFWLPIQPIASKYMASYNDHMIYSAISKNTGMKLISPTVRRLTEPRSLA